MTPAQAAAQTPAAAPARARMLVLSPDDSAIAAILRTRPGREPCAVLPGGGLEPEDADPLSGALRELIEETGLTGDDVDLLTSSVVVEGEQWIFLARARRTPALHLGGPETARDTEVHGTYEPVWLRPRIALETLGGRVHPDWITRMIAEAR
ncbi:NUDIX domain-containing protein [Brachybacterium subflavum]|uniref:NUDIX domain-containing protein n=1 Tax=Brachybacterium subflavum TaxID=2585206 RepID=UPI001D0D1111|nr:NUDIX domain-containing protein [Brachybacterium subflavum]